MNDYWNDPPYEEWPPECCDEIMDFDEATATCKCAVCGKVILPEPDITPDIGNDL